jgi:hypothetical protein
MAVISGLFERGSVQIYNVLLLGTTVLALGNQI